MRPSQVVRAAAGYLERHGVESPVPTAEQLLASVLDTDRAGVYGRLEPLRSAEANAFGRAVCRRCAGEPTQHLIGETGFRHLMVAVRPGVFIPRPETEVVVDAALDVIHDIDSPVVADVGTGTGVIALSLKQERPDARVWAIDRSPEAVALARENAARHALEVQVVEGDLLAALPQDAIGSFDLVVANLPYIEPNAYEGLPPEVRTDPVEALVGGLALFERLLGQARSRLGAGGSVVLEIGEEQAGAVGAAAIDAGAVRVAVRADLAGRDRVVVATWM